MPTKEIANLPLVGPFFRQQRYRDLPDKAVEFLRSKGEDPSKYVYDVENNTAVGREVLGQEFDTAGQIVNGLFEGREYLKGAAGSVLDTAQLPVRANLALREPLTSGLESLGVSPETAETVGTGLTRGVIDPETAEEFINTSRKGLEKVLPADPRLNWLGRGIPNVLGQAATFIGPAAIARGAGAGVRGIVNAMSGLGGMQQANQVAEAELERQLSAGEEPSMETAVAKGLPAGALSAVGGKYLGLGGAVGRALSKPLGVIKGPVARVLPEAAMGSVQEMLDQGVQETLVGSQDPMGNILRAGALGAFGQGIPAAAVNAVAGSPEKPTGAPPKLGETADDTALASEATAAETPATKPYVPTDEAIAADLAALARGEPNPTVKGVSNIVRDNVINPFAKKKIPLTEEQVRELYSTWDGKEENEDAVLAKAEEFLNQYNLQERSKPKDVGKMADEIIEKDQQDIGRMEKLQKLIEGYDKKLKEMTPGAAWASTVQAARQRAADALVAVQRQAELDRGVSEPGGVELLAEIQARRAARKASAPIPTEVQERIKAAYMQAIRAGATVNDLTNLRQVLEESGMPAEPTATDITVAKAADALVNQPPVTQEVFGPGTRRIVAPEKLSLTPELIAQLKKANQSPTQEGEQGLPFGETKTYGMGLPEDVVRRFFSADVHYSLKERPSSWLRGPGIPKEEIHGQSAHSLLNRLEKLSGISDDTKAVIQQLLAHEPLRTVPITIETLRGNQVGLMRHPRNNNKLAPQSIALDEAIRFFTSEELAGLAIHESVHALTSRYITEVGRTKTTEELYSMVSWFKYGDGQKHIKNVESSIELQFTKSKYDTFESTLSEFIADIFQHPELRVALKNAPYTKTKSAWQKLLDFFRRVLGFKVSPQVSVDTLNRSLELSFKIMDFQQQRFPGPGGTLLSPDIRYSRIYGMGLPRDILRPLQRFVAENLGERNLASLDPLYWISQSTGGRLATQNPQGALLADISDTNLWVDRDRIGSKFVAELKPHEKFLKSKVGKDWLNWRQDNGRDDVSMLTGEDRAHALAINKLVKDSAALMNNLGAYVWEVGPNGQLTARPHKMEPGYWWGSIGEQVWRARDRMGKEWDSLVADFKAAWAKKFGPKSDAMAQAAIDKMFAVLGSGEGPDGQPLFAPIILPKGVTLPLSWRSDTPVEDSLRYATRFATHLSWTKNIQNNPALRKVLGLKTDSKLNDTTATDPATWDQAPEAWRAAVRSGKRSSAGWALDADPNRPPETPINQIGDRETFKAWLGSYKQDPGPRYMAKQVAQLFGSLLLGSKTGLRDFGMSTVTALQYGDVTDTARVFLTDLFSPKAADARAAKSGVMQHDVMLSELPNDQRAFRNTVRNTIVGIRKVTMRNAADRIGRALNYDVFVDKVKADPGLIEEFGPIMGRASMTQEQIVRQTAAAMASKLTNPTDARNTPPWLLPNVGGIGSVLIPLKRWSFAQYKNVKENVFTPLVEGNAAESGRAMKRLLKLMVGSTVISAAIDGLFDWISERKPDNLTFGEWLHFWKKADTAEEKERAAKELAYTVVSYQQLIGALGAGTDLAMFGTRLAVGGKAFGNYGELSAPLIIQSMDLLEKAQSWWNALVSGGYENLNMKTVGDMLVDFSMVAQNMKLGKDILEKAGVVEREPKKNIREQQVFERVTGLDTKTMKPVALPAGREPQLGADTAAFTKRAMMADDADWEKFRGFLQQRRKADSLPVINKWSQNRRYYDELEKVIGEEEAKKVEAEDRKMDQVVREKNRKIKVYSR